MVLCSMATNLAAANNNGQIMIGMGKGEPIGKAKARDWEQKDGTRKGRKREQTDCATYVVVATPLKDLAVLQRLQHSLQNFLYTYLSMLTVGCGSKFCSLVLVSIVGRQRQTSHNLSEN